MIKLKQPIKKTLDTCQESLLKTTSKPYLSQIREHLGKCVQDEVCELNCSGYIRGIIHSKVAQ